jgi:hypothetical protein
MIIEKINKVLEDKDIMDEMLDFIFDLDPEQITEEQAVEIIKITDTIEELFKKRVKKDLGAARKRRREYRRAPAPKRRKARKYRRSAKGKLTKRKSIRAGKYGRTGTTKQRIRKFIGPKLPKMKRFGSKS